MRRTVRIAASAAAVLALGACQNMGASYAVNQPLEQADSELALPLLEQTARIEPTPPPGIPAAIEVDSTTWVPSATSFENVTEADLTSVGSVQGQTVYALKWDAAPYDRLLTRTPDGRFQEYRQVYR